MHKKIREIRGRMNKGIQGEIEGASILANRGKNDIQPTQVFNSLTNTLK